MPDAFNARVDAFWRDVEARSLYRDFTTAQLPR
jgi:hypothetical protein